ncbi:acetyl-CoA synthetase [Rhodobium orientis]|uniref:AMP-dependent synthetase n=1 Tax=Rhodobium orientis TaxID=34017 RepID=A0A327JHS1_9HYPH|nr:acyl-CoA synthetase [Rhodobium orientis]MBB4303595.1 acetyl-CoA synthetase [Rhodobium orientis]MBK5951949.1 AMP-dependent synthetase [Rhodobium orientis]RAI24874.1 AMP-dependent synthetase [Rhodobium orientis]
MLPQATDYDALRAAFRWQVPERYNIALDACDRWAVRDPDRTAIIHVAHDDTVTDVSFRHLAESSNRLANALAAHGIGRGDRVGILLPQMPETAIAHFAIYKRAGIAVPLAALFGVDALRYRLGDSGAKALVTDAAGVEKIAALADDLEHLTLVVSVDGPATAGRIPVVGLADLLQKAADIADVADTGADDPAMMIYTSGTTGPPKGALHGHRVLLGHLPGVEMPHEFLPRAGDRLWTPADWAWAGGLLNVLLPALHFGVPVLCHAFEGFDPEKAFRLMAEHRVRNAFIPPTALKLLRAVDDPNSRYDLDLRTIGSGGESLGREVYEWGRETLGLTINEFYGQTECNLVLSSCAAIGVTRIGAIGKPVPGHDVAVINATGEVAPRGTLGQIAVARPDPVMFLTYWNNAEATEEKFVGDWMLTGDQGIMDEDGYVHFVGRDDDVITSAGYRIGPGEIEDCLISHPAVKLAAAVGKPDPVRTEIVKAYVVLAPGEAPSAELADAIREHVRTRLSAHEYPREVAFVTEMPLTTTGKVIRRKFREEAQKEAAEAAKEGSR